LSRFRFHAFKYHLELADLFEKNQFTAVRWARQTGKSFSVSALLLKHLGAFGQLHCNWSKLAPNQIQQFRRMGGFCRKLPNQQGLHVQKTHTIDVLAVKQFFWDTSQSIRLFAILPWRKHKCQQPHQISATQRRQR
jgi:hypothetical protein